MPRQLPWKSNGGGESRTQTIKPKTSTRPPKTTRIPDGIDDDFFDGTILASNNKDKGKGKAKVTSDSDDSLPEAVAGTSKPRNERSKNEEANKRAPSSSPPPLADYAQPYIEPMRKGVSKFDLRDDEWMMVEDEFLETAKLFTRHLHIAEYDRLKESIEAKKKEAEVARPVVAGAKRSVEGAMKERAKVQNSRQKKAIRDVFASQEDSSEDDRASYRSKPSRPMSTTAKPKPATNGSRDTDSDDLDASRAPKPKTARPAPEAEAIPVPAARETLAYLNASKTAPSPFAKPVIPASSAAKTATAAPPRGRSRVPRMTPFDMLDEYTPPTFDTRTPPAVTANERRPSTSSKPRSRPTSSNHSSPQTLQSLDAKTVKPRGPVDSLDHWGALKESSGLGKETADRIAKRKAERAKEGDGKKKRATDLDDIPTFLF